MVGIARAFGVGDALLRQWMDEDPALQEAFNNGRDRERQVLHNSLFVAAVEDGNIIAAMFLLKSRHGYREGDQSDNANRVSINFTLPAALDPVEFLKKVEVDADTPDSDKPLSGRNLIRT